MTGNSPSEQHCKHRQSWIIAMGGYEWCYACGALRSLKRIGRNTSEPSSYWLKPVGVGAENPGDFKSLPKWR